MSTAWVVTVGLGLWAASGVNCGVGCSVGCGVGPAAVVGAATTGAGSGAVASGGDAVGWEAQADRKTSKNGMTMRKGRRKCGNIQTIVSYPLQKV